MRFVIIAILRREYGEMAANLVVSLRSAMPECKITIITDGTYRGDADNIIHTTETNPFKIKTELYGLIKDKQVCYIDADTIVNNPARFRAAMDKLKDQKLFIQKYRTDVKPGDNHGPETWGSVQGFADHYGFKYAYPVYNSSVIFWTRSREIGAWWKQVEKNYLNPPKLNETILGKVPDEVAFGSASAMTGTMPDSNDRITWFRWETGHFRDYPFLSLAGANIPNVAVQRYNALAKDNGRAAGVQFFEFKQKYKRGRI